MRPIAIVFLAACGATPPRPVAPANHVPPAPPSAPDDPVARYEAQLVHSTPTEDAFAHLADGLAQLTPAQRAAVAAIGTKADAPIRVPSIRYEYVWVAQFACVGGEGQVGMQALINHGKVQLDDLQFTCPGSSATRDAFFDFSEDPEEKAMKQQLGN